MVEERGDYVLVHVKMEKELYLKLWEVAKNRYSIPTKKLHIILNEALRKGLRLMEDEKSK